MRCFPTVAVLLLLPPTLLNSEAGAQAPPTLKLPASVRAECLSVLRAGMQSDDFWPSIHATEGLTLGGHGDEVLKYWTPRLSEEKDDQRRCGIARELYRAGKFEARKTLLAILESDDPHGHIHAAESLYKIGEIGDGRALRTAMGQSSNSILQLMAAAALGKAGSPYAMKLIRNVVRKASSKSNHVDPGDLRIAAWILARIGDSSDIPLLQAARATAAQDAVVNIDHALASLGEETGLAAIRRNLTSDEAATRTFAATFVGDARLMSIGELLPPMLEDAHFDARIRAAQSLLVLASPPVTHASRYSNVPFPASAAKPRNTEGSVIRLNDGTLLMATTEFISSGSDFGTAHIVAKRSYDVGRTWSDSVELQKNTGMMNVMSATLRRMNDGELGMFYLEKNSHQDLRVLLRRSGDQGETFGEAVSVTSKPGYHVMNNDRVVRLRSGRWLAPIASSPDVRKQNHFISSCCFSDDDGKTWRHGTGSVDAPKRGAMEPEVVELEDGRLMMLVRTQLGHIGKAYSTDQGDTWGELQSLGVASPESPCTCRRIPATGDLLLIWNDGFDAKHPKGGIRTPLNASISKDDGDTWSLPSTVVEPDKSRTYAYTSLCFAGGNALLSFWDTPIGTSPARYSTRFLSMPTAAFYTQ